MDQVEIVSMGQVKTGLEVLIGQDFGTLRGKRVGLVTHPAAVDSKLRSTIEVFANAPLQLSAIFGPEHGLHGQAQDLIGVTESESKSIRKVYSLYGKNAASLRPTPESLKDLDILVVDLQDIGSRYYTFQATMLYSMQVAMPLGLPVMVLDRPNPLGGVHVEGPALQRGFESFVGAHNIAIRHGMTIGELALYYTSTLNLGPGEVQVVPCEGLKREDYFDATGLPWVFPSPNMPTLDTAIVYPGQCLIEGTNLSEGRGTTRPFEISGAPWLDAEKLAKGMNDLALPGVIFRPLWFRPTFQKHAGKDCGGVQMHVTDRGTFRSVRTSLALLTVMREMSGDHFQWRTEEYEFVKDPIAIDLLFGSSRERKGIEAGVDWREIAEAWTAEENEFNHNRHGAWLY